MAEEKKTRVKETMGGKSKPKKRKKKNKPIHHMMIRHAANGGYITEHHEQPEEQEDENTQAPEHAVSSLEDLHQHLDDHMAEAPQQAQGQAPVQQVTGT